MLYRALCLAAVLLCSSEEATSLDYKTGESCECDDTFLYMTASGQIAANEVALFLAAVSKAREKQQHLAQTPPIIIALDSGGGDLDGAIQLGRQLRKMDAHVHVGILENLESRFSESDLSPGLCASACVYALMGGRVRSVTSKSRIGVHQFYDQRKFGDPQAKVYSNSDVSYYQALYGVLIAYSLEMGVSPQVVEIASKKESATEATFLTSEELRSTKLVDDLDQLLPWQLLAKTKRVVARSSSTSGGYTATFICDRASKSPVRLLELAYSKSRKEKWRPERTIDDVTAMAGSGFTLNFNLDPSSEEDRSAGTLSLEATGATAHESDSRLTIRVPLSKVQVSRLLILSQKLNQVETSSLMFVFDEPENDFTFSSPGLELHSNLDALLSHCQ